MKNIKRCLILLFFAFGCSNEAFDDLEPNILENEDIPLVTYQNLSLGSNGFSIGFTSIYDQLSPETQASIIGYNVYRNDIALSPLPLTANRLFGTGPSGKVVCLAVAFRAANGQESRRSGTYCKQIP